MTSTEVQKHLQAFFYETHPFQTLNFSRCGYSECDVFMINKSNQQVIEIEVKISLSDFRADFKKDYKHSLLKERNASTKHKIPSHFYFACPEGLISVDLIPEYAGLLYIKQFGEIQYIKTAPKLHKIPVDMKTLFAVTENLTAKTIFGCQFMTHKHRVNHAKIQESKALKDQKVSDFIQRFKDKRDGIQEN